MIKVIGLIALKDTAAFDQYRAQVGATVARYGGVVNFRGRLVATYWNELPCPDFNAFVELEFADLSAAQRWADSPEYQALVPIRQKAMDLTLLGMGE